MLRRTICRTICLALAVALLAPGMARADGLPDTALVVEARVAFGGAVGADGTTLSAIPSVDIGVRLINRLQLTLGFQFARFAATTVTNPGGPLTTSVSTSATAFTAIPELSVDIFRAADRKVAFYAKAGIPIGGAFVGNGTNTTAHWAVGYDVGVGTRWLPHDNFAIGLEAGVTGLFADTGDDNSIGVTTFYGALVGSFYWAPHHDS